MKKKLCLISAYSALFIVLCTNNVNAYLDSATTSYLIQIGAGIIIAAGTTVGIFRKKISKAFRDAKIKRLEEKLNKQQDKI